VPKSNCKFSHKFSLKLAAKSTKRSPCTNRPVECPRCKDVFWSYNIAIHYELIHIGEEIPAMITLTEIENLKKIGI